MGSAPAAKSSGHGAIGGAHMSKIEFEQQVEAAKREFEMEVAAIRREFSNKLEAVSRERNKKRETAFTRKAKALLHELENDLLKQDLRLFDLVDTKHQNIGRGRGLA
jgi:hypothetical protein